MMIEKITALNFTRPDPRQVDLNERAADESEPNTAKIDIKAP